MCTLVIESTMELLGTVRYNGSVPNEVRASVRLALSYAKKGSLQMSKIVHISDLINVDAVNPEEMGAYDKVQFLAWTVGVAVANTHTAAHDLDWQGYADVRGQLDKVRDELATLSVVIMEARNRAIERAEKGEELSTLPW